MNTLSYRPINLARWMRYTLCPQGVEVCSRSITGKDEWLVAFDKIGIEPKHFIIESWMAKLLTLLFLIVSAATGFVSYQGGDAEEMAWVFWLVIALLALSYHRLTRLEGYEIKSEFGSLVLAGKRGAVFSFF